MNLRPFQANIVEWHDREWFDRRTGHPKTEEQIANKLAEECGETVGAIVKMCEGRPDYMDGLAARDEIGDVLIVLSVLCDRLGTTLKECLENRWATVQHRKSKDYTT